MKHKFKLATAIGIIGFSAGFNFKMYDSNIAMTIFMLLLVAGAGCWVYFGDKGDNAS